MSRWPLVGRAEVLDRVVAVLTGRRGGGLLLAGPAGMGKTRLLAAARHRAARSGVPVHWAVATAAAAGIPFGPFAHLLPEPPPADLAGRLGATTARLTGGALVVDDAHLLDPASAALVDHLLANTAVPVVLATRSPTRWSDLERVELAPLDEAQVAEVVTEVLDGPVESALPATLARLSQGNPLLLRELVQAALAGTALERHGGVWRMTGPLVAAATLPATIGARLDRLAPRVRAAAELVALAEPVPPDLVERLLPADLIAALEDERLLADAGTGIGLTHPLYGEALRAALPPMRARRHRRALADAVEATGRDRIRVALWRLDAGLPADPALLLAAAQEASEALDHELAGRLAEAAVAAGGGFAARLALLPELLYQGERDRAVALADELTRAAADEHDRVRVATARANVELILGEPDRARSTLAAAFDATTDPELRRGLAVQQAAQAFSTGHIGLCLELGDQALRDGDLDPTPLDATLLGRLAVARVRALACAGRTADGIAFAERALDAGPAPARAAMVRMALLHALALDGRLADAREVGTAGLAQARTGPAAALRAFWTHELGQSGLLAGHATQARQWLRETLAVLPIAGLPASPQLWSIDGLAEAAALLGDADDAAAQAGRLRAVLPAGFVALRRSGAVWALADHPREAVALAWRSAGELETVGAQAMAAWVLHDAARLGDAARVAPRLVALAQRCQGALVPAMAANARALAAGDANALDRAAGRFAHLGADLYAAEAAAQARLLHRGAGRRGSALSSAARAQALAARCGPLRTPLLAPQADPLTPREREVARLAARGLTDRAIADRLQLSLRTVQSHLYRAYRKLGVADRGALADVLN